MLKSQNSTCIELRQSSTQALSNRKHSVGTCTSLGQLSRQFPFLIENEAGRGERNLQGLSYSLSFGRVLLQQFTGLFLSPCLLSQIIENQADSLYAGIRCYNDSIDIDLLRHNYGHAYKHINHGLYTNGSPLILVNLKIFCGFSSASNQCVKRITIHFI